MLVSCLFSIPIRNGLRNPGRVLNVFFQFLSVGFEGQHAIEDDTKETWVPVVLQQFFGEGDG